MKFRRGMIACLLLVVGLLGSGCGTLPGPSGEPFTVVVLPDTQNYADAGAIQKGGDSDRRAIFHAQTAWIKNSKDDLNTVMVAHEGDIVQTDHPGEWVVADKAFQTLDDEMPYILCLGNHDIGRGFAKKRSDTSRATNLNVWFPPSRFEDNPLYNYGGNFEGKSDNYYLLFRAGGMKFMIMALEFKPRDEVLAWANDVVADHPKRRCIVITHAYLREDMSRAASDNYHMAGNGGQKMWDKFLKRHKNIFLVLCGHILGEARRADAGDRGNTVHQLLADYQGMANGGDGYLRIMTFIPQEDTIQVRSYSPTLDQELTGEQSRFSIPYDMR
ncbi:MAG: metallophosphoesterase [Nitrospiraceae bacterium]|nr:metallophosphoesterase [Nitrospiraceae bacterium]